MAVHGIDRWRQARLWTLFALIAACFLFGGSSRLDVPSLVLLQPLAVLAIAMFVLTPGTMDWDPVRVPLALLAALAAVHLVQLIPLPPGLWAGLPGHGQLADNLDGVVDPVWRPATLTPDLTLASLASLCVPLAVLVGMTSVSSDQRGGVVTLLIILILGSAILGVAQVAGGADSPFYFYRITNPDTAVGLFANRNHQAVLVVVGWPLIALWLVSAVPARSDLPWRWIAFGIALFLIPVLLVAGSRAGIVLAPVGLGVAALLLLRHMGGRGQAPRRRNRLALGIGLGLAVLIMAGIAALAARTVAIDRLLGTALDEENRIQTLPTLMAIARDFFPVGSGFGSFDPVFRLYEPDALLSPLYLNHAHNDLLEVVIVAGLPGAILAATLVGLVVVAGVRAARDRDTGHSAAHRLVGTAIALILLAASTVDYPLRTPAHGALLAIALVWMQARSGRVRRTGGPTGPETALR